MDLSAATCSTAKALVLLGHHGKFAECGVDSELLTAADRDLVIKSVSEVLDPRFDISQSAKMEAAAMLFNDESAALLANKNTGL